MRSIQGSFEFQDLVGKPFRFGARGPEEFDCWGLVRECLLRQGLDPPDFPSSCCGEENGAVMEGERASQRWRRLPGPEIGCIVALRMNSGMITHVGVVVAPNRFLHVLKDTLTCVERLDHPLWVRRIMGYYRFNG